MGRSQIPRVLMTLTLVLLQASSPELAAVFRSGSSKQSRDPPTQRSGWHLRLSTLQIDDPWLAHEVARVSAKPPKGDILKWGCFWGQQKAKWRLVPHFPLCFLTQFLPFSVSSLSVECSKDVSRVRTPFTLSTGSVPPSPSPHSLQNKQTLWHFDSLHGTTGPVKAELYVKPCVCQMKRRVHRWRLGVHRGSWPGLGWDGPGLAPRSADASGTEPKGRRKSTWSAQSSVWRRGSNWRWWKSMWVVLERPVGTQPVAKDCRRRVRNRRESGFIQAIMNMSPNVFCFFKYYFKVKVLHSD